MDKNNYSVIACHGGFDKRPSTSSEATELIFICR